MVSFECAWDGIAGASIPGYRARGSTAVCVVTLAIFSHDGQGIRKSPLFSQGSDDRGDESVFGGND